MHQVPSIQKKIMCESCQAVRKKGLKKKQRKPGRAAKKHSQKTTEVTQVKPTPNVDDAVTAMTKTQPTAHPDMLETQVVQDSQGQPEWVDGATSAALCAPDTASLVHTVGLESEDSNGQEGHEGAEEETRTDDECVVPTEKDSNPHAKPAKPMMMTQIDRNPRWKRLRATSFLMDRTPVAPAQPPASEQPPSHTGPSSSNTAPGPPHTHGLGTSSEAASAAAGAAEVEESKPGNSPGVEEVMDSDGGDDEKSKKAAAQRGPHKDSMASSPLRYLCEWFQNLNVCI